MMVVVHMLATTMTVLFIIKDKTEIIKTKLIN